METMYYRTAQLEVLSYQYNIHYSVLQDLNQQYTPN